MLKCEIVKLLNCNMPLEIIICVIENLFFLNPGYKNNKKYLCVTIRKRCVHYVDIELSGRTIKMKKLCKMFILQERFLNFLLTASHFLYFY